MKNTKLVVGLALIAIGFTSCKDEKKEQAKIKVDSYVMYVDSLSNVATTDTNNNWNDIEAAFKVKSTQAEAALEVLADDADAKARVEASKAKYETMKANLEKMRAKALAAMPLSPKQKMRNALFGEGKVGNDMNFAWVNKDNIVNVYQQFVTAVQDSKEAYSREDWDEIKLMYEALDSRKNTVENEGLTSADNNKIAGLKLKFAPMYTLNRMGAKTSEMKSAKE